MKKILFLLVAVLGLGCGGTLGAQLPDIKKLEKTLDGELVEVVYDLQYDKFGNPPAAVGIYCAACSVFHDQDLGRLLENRQPLRVTGYMVGNDLVLAPDIFIDADGVKNLQIQYRGQSAAASVKTVYPEQGAVLLQLREPLPGSRVMEFTPELSGELFAYSRIMENGRWVARLQPFSRERAVHFYAPDRYSYMIPGNSVIVNSQGKVAAVLTNSNETINQTQWNTPWTSWQGIAAQAFARQRGQLAKHLRQSIWPVTVYFKSWTLSRRERLQGVEPLREVYSYVLKLPDNRLIMPLATSAKLNGLIDKVIVHAPDKDIPGAIKNMLKDYCCVELELPDNVVLPPIAYSIASLHENFGLMIWSAAVTAYSKSLDIKLYSDILGGVVAGLDGADCGMTLKNNMVADLAFTLQGSLLGLNINVSAYQYGRRWPLLGAGALEKLLNTPGKILPPEKLSNPADGVAFPGVEYQPMTRELAKSLNMEHLTNKGSEGLLVTYVFADSPGAALKLQPGDVLLKIIPPVGGPISLTGKKFAYPQERQFPWEQLDSIAEMYFSEIPEPWRGIKTPLNNLLTAIGIGQKVELIGIHKGKLFRKNWQIQAAPTYFEIAPAYQSPSLGIEVRDLTFEVRRYFRMDKVAPGVIVGNISAGSPAATAGLKPFEIIVAVNDKPVFSANDFKQCVRQGAALQLAVRRLGTNRVVTVHPKLGPLK